MELPMEHLTTPRAIVARYGTHAEAEAALSRLDDNGFDVEKVAIVAADLYTEETAKHAHPFRKRIVDWSLQGAFWGGFWGLLFGFSTYAIPFIGPVLLRGPVGAVVAGTGAAVLLGVAGGLLAVIAGLFFPIRKSLEFHTTIKAIA